MISTVDDPTPWCAGMVVIPKKSGAVRICINLKPLSEGVLRQVHPMPNVDKTLALFTGAKMFSKLDVNNGFWQIPLADESLLTISLVSAKNNFSGACTWMCVTRERYTLSRF